MALDVIFAFLFFLLNVHHVEVYGCVCLCE